MPGKITDYPTMTTLASGDLMDVSDYDGVSAFTSKSLDWDDLKTNIESQITFTNLYTNDGTLAGNRIVSMGLNDLTFGSTGDANLLKFETTNDRIGIGVAAPSEKLEIAGNAKVNGTFKTQSASAIPVNLYKEGVGNNMIQLSMQNDAAAEYQFAQVGGSVIDDTAGSEEGAFLVQLSNNGTVDSLGVHKFLINGLHQFPESINGGIFRESNSGGFRWSLNLRNSANTIEPYAALATEVIDNTNGSEDGVLKFYARSNGVNFNSSNHQAILTGTGLGIGTAAPTEKLEVVGNGYINGLIGCNVSPIAGQALTINSTGSTTEKALQIRTVANVERFFIQGDGKSELTGRLGINDTTVQGAQNYMFWAKGDPSASKLFGLADNSGNLKMEMSSVGRLTLNSNDTGTQVGFGVNSAFSTTVGILGKTGNIYALKVGVGANVNKLNVKGNNDNYGVGIMVNGTDATNLKIGASTTTHSSINFVNGVAPTSPNDGDFWFDGTDLFIQVSGTTYTLTKT